MTGRIRGGLDLPTGEGRASEAPPEVEIRAATDADGEAIRELLAASGLPVEDLGAVRPEFIVACEGGKVIGCAGAEHHGPAALLRSLAVAGEHRGRGLGDRLLRSGVEEARRRGARDLYALTSTIEPLLVRRGFVRVERREVPDAVRRSPQFASTGCASATCLRLTGAVRDGPA